MGIREKSSTSETWGGNFQVVNNYNGTITWVSAEHFCEGMLDFATITEASLNKGGISSTKPFTTTSGESDYWVISFLNPPGSTSPNLITGILKMDFHSSSAGSTVLISLNQNDFSVTINGDADSAPYQQIVK